MRSRRGCLLVAAGDAPVDPGNYLHVSPIVTSEAALNRPHGHAPNRSGKKLP